MSDATTNYPTELPVEVASLLIPMKERPLLLPNVAVAEIVPLIEPTLDYSTPDWHIGSIVWRGVKIPLLSVDALNDLEAEEISDDSHIAVINGVGDHAELPFYAFLVTGIPRLIRVIDQEIGREDKETGPAESMYVQVGGEHAVILDLEYIEAKILGK
ncbi:MAG: chemotaxis protein CheW [Pseudomonadales bacterium]|nr:chemotaxis protein CheW [Pseudomonadales bacterium]